MKRIYEGLARIEDSGGGTRITLSPLAWKLVWKRRTLPLLVIETDAAVYVMIAKEQKYGKSDHTGA